MLVRTLAAAGVALVACAALAQPAAPLRIGVIGPFSGPSADFGVPMLNGIKLAQDEINAVGGYLGRRLELVIKDDGADPDTGLARSKELVAAKVTATIGFCNTGVAMKSLDQYQQGQVPLIVPCASGSPVTAKFPAPQSYVFRTSARDAIQAPFIVEDALKRGWDKVAVFADSTGYGEAGLQDVQKALAVHNLKPVHVARFPLGVKDLSQELAAARTAGAEVVLSYTVGPENAVIADGRKAIGWKVTQIGAWPLSFPNFIEGSPAAEGSLMAQTFIAEPSNERRAAFLSAYARKYNLKRIAVPMAAAQAYDATYLLLYGLFGIRDGNLNGPAVKASLENLQRVYYGVVATYEKPFSPDDKDAITQNMLVVGMVKDKAITFAYPEDAKRNLFVQRKK
jgi:branched-chain amino acid transport system substrate-binding protein